jgi:hypothetical protein
MTPIHPIVIRNNLGTWAIPPCAVPAVASVMVHNWEPEPYDPNFYGQYLQTTYFDTPSRAFRKARLKGDRYCTVRLRAYHPAQGAGYDYPPGRYAVSAKTEEEKDRYDITPALAKTILTTGQTGLVGLLTSVVSPSIAARIWEIADNEPLIPVFTVCANRFATENEADRLTLDIATHTDTGKRLEFGVLEFKSIEDDPIPEAITLIPGIRPTKMSKALWAGEER